MSAVGGVSLSFCYLYSLALRATQTKRTQLRFEESVLWQVVKLIHPRLRPRLRK